jgi:hypothetical protein
MRLTLPVSSSHKDRSRARPASVPLGSATYREGSCFTSWRSLSTSSAAAKSASITACAEEMKVTADCSSRTK